MWHSSRWVSAAAPQLAESSRCNYAWLNNDLVSLGKEDSEWSEAWDSDERRIEGCGCCWVLLVMENGNCDLNVKGGS